LLLALLVFACSRQQVDERGTENEARARDGSAAQRDVADTTSVQASMRPTPPSVALEPAVAAALEAARSELDAAIASQAGDGEVARLAGRLGMLALAYDLGDLAEPPLEVAAARDAATARWPYYLGRARRIAGDPAGAIAALRHAIELDPEYRAARLELADVLAKAGDPTAAAEAAREALARRPDDAAALGALGRAELALGDPAHAVEHLEAALRLEPGATLLHHPLGLAYRALGREQDARRELALRGAGAAEVEDPLMDEVRALATGASALERRANHELASGDLRDAAASLHRVLDADPERLGARTNLAAVAMADGHLDAARAELDAALRADPNDSRALAALGALLARQGRDLEAVPRYEQALAIDPGDRDALYNLGNALRRTGRAEEAVARYRRVIELDPGHRQARFALAVTLTDLRRYGEAARLLEESHAALPEDREIANELARLLASAPVDGLRDGQRALELAQPLLAADASIFHAETVAMALAELGRFDEAARMEEAVLDAVRREGRADLATGVEADLERYRRREPQRLP
jgi:tetratricopeptide (TPR) repeat protein